MSRRGRVAFLCLAWALVGCASLAGLSGGDAGQDAPSPPAKDATREARAIIDATPDAPPVDAPPADAGPPDGGHDVGSRDVVDASDGGDADTGVDVSCSPILIDAGSAPLCPVVEAGACAPQNVSPAALSFRPPLTGRGLCTPAQVSAIIAGCFSDTSTADTCNAFIDSDGGFRCLDCVASNYGDPRYGPIVVAGDVYYVNVGGCVDLVDPCNASCAASTQAAELCGVASCAAACSALDESPEQTDAYAGCASAANDCACQSVKAAAAACENTLGFQASTARCYDTNGSFTDVISAYAELFCGTGDLKAVDGG